MEKIKEYNWKNYRKGVIVITVVHFVLKIVLDGPKENGSILLIGPVIFNYLIASWFIKWKIKNGFSSNKPFIFGIKISAIIFIAQLILGYIFIYTSNKLFDVPMIINKENTSVNKIDTTSLYMEIMPDAVEELNKKIAIEKNNLFDSVSFNKSDSMLTLYYRMKTFSINEQIEKNDLSESDVKQFLINYKIEMKRTIDSIFSTHQFKDFYKHKIGVKYKYYDRLNLQLGEFNLYE